MVERKDVMKIVTDYASEIALEGKGALFVISKKNISNEYDLLYGKFIKPFPISDPTYKPVVKSLATLDGAIIIRNGKIVDVGARINTDKNFRGHGTRHSAAYSISHIPGVISVLSSEEDGVVRIFKNGRLFVELDPRTRSKRGVIDKIAEIVTSEDASILASTGVASVALGINPLAALIVFAGSYVVTAKGMATIREFIKKGLEVLVENKSEKS